MSNSSLSENVSINNDTDTPPTPLTPPPSPLLPDEKPIARAETSEYEKPMDDIIIENGIEHETDAQPESQDGQNVKRFFFSFFCFVLLCENIMSLIKRNGIFIQITETLPNKQDVTDELSEVEGDSVVPDNYSMPYFSPYIFVPPMPFVPGSLRNENYILCKDFKCLNNSLNTKTYSIRKEDFEYQKRKRKN